MYRKLRIMGGSVLLDEGDLERVASLRWKVVLLSGKNVAECYDEPGLYLHNFIWTVTGRTEHWDGDGLNCTRFNLYERGRPWTGSDGGTPQHSPPGETKSAAPSRA